MKNDGTSYRIKLISGGRGFVFSSDIGENADTDAYIIEDGLDGFDSPPIEVKLSSYGALEGGYVEKRRYGERELTIAAELRGEGAEAEARRNRLVSMLDTVSDCVLETELYGVRRRISVVPAGECRFTRGILGGRVTAELSLLAPGVFFEDSAECTVVFRSLAPALTFPLNSMKGAGFVSGVYRTTTDAEADNPGDAECGFTVVINADGGQIVNPGIECGGAHVRCPVTLEDGGTLVISTVPRHKTVTLNGEKYRGFDADSVFFSLPRGKNKVSVICDSGGEYVRASLSFTPLYCGA